MSRPQKSVVYKANATALGDMAKPVRDAASKLAESGERVHNTVYEFDWEGHTKNAADERADRELTQDRTVAADLHTLADAYENGQNTMQPIIDGLRTKAQGLESDNFAVSEDWVVTDIFDYGAASGLAKLMGLDDADMTQLQTTRANEATTETVNLQHLADDLGTADTATATAIGNATEALTGSDTPQLVLPPGLAPGQVANLGPVAGVGEVGIPGIGAADLGEIIQLPDGQYVAILGDSYAGNKQGVGSHYPSAAVPVTFDAQGHAIFGAPLTGPDGQNVLFFLPQAAKDAGANNTLPAGSIKMRDGSTIMMVVGTNTSEGLNPKGGSWLVNVNNDPGNGWSAINGSYRPWTPNAQPSAGKPSPGTNPNSPPMQISGYQASDGNVYIAADAFDRSQGVTMYRVDPQHVADRNAWQPWTGHNWGHPGQHPTSISNGQNFGELSFRDVGGKSVLSGFNGTTGSTEVRVANSPTQVFAHSTTTVVAPGGHWGEPGKVPQNYGGYIMPGATLNNMGILVSQWNTGTGRPYSVEQFQVNPSH